ncbi:MAG TPA: hypothetical protein VKS79_07625 [Gemmataceae bacterium]|nr:hypothetical protein [Gemmataceae bacterium]
MSKYMLMALFLVGSACIAGSASFMLAHPPMATTAPSSSNLDQPCASQDAMDDLCDHVVATIDACTPSGHGFSDRAAARAKREK